MEREVWRYGSQRSQTIEAAGSRKPAFKAYGGRSSAGHPGVKGGA